MWTLYTVCVCSCGCGCFLGGGNATNTNTNLSHSSTTYFYFYYLFQLSMAKYLCWWVFVVVESMKRKSRGVILVKCTELSRNGSCDIIKINEGQWRHNCSFYFKSWCVDRNQYTTQNGNLTPHRPPTSHCCT